jgi:hypothetical protein
VEHKLFRELVNLGIDQDTADQVAQKACEGLARSSPSHTGDVVERVFAEKMSKQSERLKIFPQENESPGQWMLRVRKAALLEAIGSEATAIRYNELECRPEWQCEVLERRLADTYAKLAQSEEHGMDGR